MNIKQLFLPLFGALALIGCNNEALEPTSSNEAETQPVRLALTMEATADASEMRAIIFDTSKGIPPTAGNTEAKWTTHCFLHKSGDASKRAYAVIEWDVTNATAGQIKLKMRGSELSLQQSGSQPLVIPQPGERWIITGITGGGKLNADKTRVEFSADGAYDALEANQALVPFTFEPQGFDVASEGMRAPQISVHFKPQGSLLNVHVNNATNRGKHAVATDLKLYTNALSNNGYYDYSTGEAQWKFTNAAAQEEVISRPISLDKDADAKYVLWGMPRPETAKPSEGFKSEIYLGRYKIFAEGSTTAKPKVREEAFDNGIAYPMGINIDRPFMPLEYVAEYNVAEDRASFATTHDAGGDRKDSDAEYVTLEEAQQLFKHITIDSKNYHLPNVNEGAGLASKLVPNIIQVIRDNGGAIPLGHKETVSNRSFQIENKLYEGYEDQIHYAEDLVQYALRFINDAKDMVIAYRYSYFPNEADFNKSHIVISSRYIGPKSVSLDDISTAAYWDNNNHDDVHVIYPIKSCAVLSPTGVKGVLPNYFNKIGYYWLDYDPNEVLTDEERYFFQFAIFRPKLPEDSKNFRVTQLSPRKGNLQAGRTFFLPVRLFSDRVY